jgi:hypothetical protein
MNVNYWETGLIIVVTILLVIWLVRRNNRDEETYEEEFIRSELKPEEHKDHDDPSANNV